MDQINHIEQEIAPLREQLTNHQVYRTLEDLEDIRTFMETHVYAVWDFMSLLKALQNALTCTSLPWKPVQNAKTARFINEIVFGEETDVNENGVPNSHYEMYLDSMEEVGADTQKIKALVDAATSVDALFEYLEVNPLSKAVKAFLRFTFETVQTGAPHKIASAFTFGREDLIPDMFIEILNQSGPEHKTAYPKLTYYLERHIEVDGDEHGPLSLEMIKELCGADERKWQEAKEIAKQALVKRIQLWDEVAEAIQQKKGQISLMG